MGEPVVDEQPTEVHVGRYRLRARIGEGGMGVVHLAEGPDGARVALKVLRPHVVGDDEARERLAREVASLRRVTSPRVAEVIDADPWGDTPFVATRYVPGLSLHQHVRQEGPLAGRDLAALATGLAEAVAAVHRVGVLHRDIKPSNVLLEGRAPVLIDFGLARLTEDPRLTQTGWLLGTPGYLAPEILYGDDATTASDVHSWAATVVFAATGRPPFGTGPAMAIMDRVRRGEHDLSAVPPDLLPLLRACLAPDPRARPGTDAVLSVLTGLHRDVPPPRGPAWGTAPVPGPTSAGGSPETPTRVHARSDRTRQVTQVARVAQVAQVTDTADRPPRPEPVVRPALQRRAVLAGLFATVALGFAKAPYLSLLVLALAALGVRTLSWVTESAADRQRRRGRRRWYDAPLTLLSTPWYLVVATGGTLVLLVWSAVVALVVGCAYLLFRGPLVPGLLVMGSVVAACVWWGPGGRRVRAPTRRLARALTGDPWLGWLGVAVVVATAGVCAYALVTGGVVWDPQPGPPWRDGTLLDDLLDWF